MVHISYSCPISIVLFGAYGIPYGKPVISCATNFQLRVDLLEKPKTSKKLETSSIEDKVKTYLKKRKVIYKEKGFEAKVVSDFPFSKNESWQAAYELSLTASLLKLYSGKDFPKEELNSLVYQIAREKNKRETGLLIAASCFGGLLYYRREFEFLKTLSRFQMKIPQKIENNLYLIDTGKPEESHAEIESFVGEAYNKDPKKLEEVLNKLEKMTKRLVTSIAMENLIFFKKNIQEYQTLLMKLKVVSKTANTIIKDLKKIGEATILGYGGQKKGSGLLLGYFEDENKLQHIVKKHTLNFSRFRMSGEGIKNLSV